jgi:GNAT superfamily N-acetyltransferase
MTDFRFVTALGVRDPVLIEAAARFWLTHGLLEREEIEDAGHAVCSVAYADAEIAGVATVDFRDHPPLGSRFAFIHLAVAPSFRRRGLARQLVRHTLIVMEGWSLANPRERLQGLAAVIKTPLLKDKAGDPVWSDYYADLNFAGPTPGGGQLRVAWFRHARID